MSDTAHIQSILKVCFIHGLQEIVLEEILSHTGLIGKIHLLDKEVDCLYFTIGNDSSDINSGGIDSGALNRETYSALLSLKSVTHIFLVKISDKIHPQYINTHKSILGNMVNEVINLGIDSEIDLGIDSGINSGIEATTKKSPFKTFKLRCAGSDSPEVISIQNYISETFKIKPSDEADLDIYIHKPDALWEIGVRITPRPLSVREYKIEHIKGGINPTVAYAMNTFALRSLFSSTENVDSAESTNTFSYLNICSGSATLLIEAGITLGSARLSNNDTKQHRGAIKLLGFDNNKKTNSQAVRNILNAGLIQNIQIKNANLLDMPDFGDTLGSAFDTFDTITADLPFGMQIGKDEDLTQLYKTFVEYCTSKLKQNGVLVVYTTETETFERALRNTVFKTEKRIPLRIMTSSGSYIQPNIFVCIRK